MESRKLITMIALILATCLFWPAYASAADTTPTYPKMRILWGHSGAVTDTRHPAALRIAEYLREKSGGNIELEVYPSNQLGDSRIVIEGIQRGGGGVHITYAPGTSASQFVPTLGVIDLPYFAPTDLEKARAFLRGPFGEALRASTEEYNIHVLNVLSDHFSAIIGHAPFRTPEEFNGKKFRAMASKVQVKMLESWGGSGVFLDMQEAFTALQTRVIDGIPGGVGQGTYNYKFYEIGKYLTFTRHNLSPLFILCNKSWYEGLDEATRQLLDEAVAHGVEWYDTARAEVEERAIKEMAASGCEMVYLTDAQIQVLKDLALEPCLELYYNVAGDKGRALVKIALEELVKLQ